MRGQHTPHIVYFISSCPLPITLAGLMWFDIPHTTLSCGSVLPRNQSVSVDHIIVCNAILAMSGKERPLGLSPDLLETQKLPQAGHRWPDRLDAR